MLIHEMEQRSDEWHAVRVGKITGTSFTTMANGKKDTIEKLCLQTAAEKLTGRSCESGYTNAAMENGCETEALGRQAYEATQLVHVAEVGFIELDEYIGCSPDGMVGDGGFELKCPMAHTHLGYLLDPETLPKKYKWQVQGFLWVTGRAWIDVVSFNELFPPDKQLLIVRVLPDADAFEKLEAGADYCRKRIAEILNGVTDGVQTT